MIGGWSILKKKKIKHTQKYMSLIIMCVVALGIAGVGYAYWNDLLNINTSIETGFIEPYFASERSDDNMDAIKIDINDDKSEMELSGNGVGIYGQEVIVEIDDAKGAIPTKIKEIKVKKAAKCVKIVRDSDTRFTITIDAEEAGIYDFEYEIVCEQAY